MFILFFGLSLRRIKISEEDLPELIAANYLRFSGTSTENFLTETTDWALNSIKFLDSEP